MKTVFFMGRNFGEVSDLRKSKDLVYLNWYRFDEGNIDQISLKDLTEYFDDFWYSASDDIDVFDSTLAWVLSIDHDGCLFQFTKDGVD